MQADGPPAMEKREMEPAGSSRGGLLFLARETRVRGGVITMASRYINERDRTLYGVNFDLLDGITLTENGFPAMEPVKELPKVDEVIEFNRVKTNKGRPGNQGVHFFIDDYQYERIWNCPWKYIDLLKQYKFIIQPQFSIYTDFPKPLQQYNHYRNQLLGAFWQRLGMTVVPTPEWADESSFEWVWDGLPEGGWHVIPTVGVMRYKEAKTNFVKGLRNFLDAKHPEGILVYGITSPEIENMLAREKIRRVVVRQGQRIRHDAWLLRNAAGT